MPKSLKLNSLLVLALAITFFLFFDQTKHLPALRDILPFGEDPYDAVGSFGVQLAFFAALLAALRAFRPYDARPGTSQVRLLICAQVVSILAVVVTLEADLAAMLLRPSMWQDAARLLISLLSGMILLTGLTGWRVVGSMEGGMESKQGRPRIRTWISVPASLAILAIYPDAWRESLPGAILTAVVGMTFLFLQTRILSAALTSAPEGRFEDALDDLTAVYHRLKSRSGNGTGLFELLERWANVAPVRALFNWLNPRKHAWRPIVLIGLAAGSALALAEALGEGLAANADTVILVLGVFIGLESAAFLLGYALLARTLGLFRKDVP